MTKKQEVSRYVCGWSVLLASSTSAHLTARDFPCLQEETEDVKRDWREYANQQLVKVWQEHFQGDVPPEDGPVPAKYAQVWEHFGSNFTDAEKERIIRAIDVGTVETLEVRFRLLVPISAGSCANWCHLLTA